VNCPYCAEEIKDEAVVCRHCGRDFTLFKTLLDQMRAMAGRIESLESAKAEHEKLLGQGAGTEAPVRHGPRGMGAGDVLNALTTPVLALIGAHLVVVMLLDLNTWVIRTVSLVLPLPFAALAAAKGRGRLAELTLLGLAIAVLSVLGMLAVTGLMDHHPILPRDGREWREVVEYGFSIFLSYLTGALIIRLFVPHDGGQRGEPLIRKLAQFLARMMGPKNESRPELESRTLKLIRIFGAVMPFATGTASLFSGLRKLWE
jgi:hypothetical protein